VSNVTPAQNPSTNSSEAAAGLKEEEDHDFSYPIYAFVVVNTIRSQNQRIIKVGKDL